MISKNKEHLDFPIPILGTAMWGWTTPKSTCFQMLNEYYRQGYREVDAATNYPINKIPADFRRSENILLEWIQTHGITDLKVMMKVGSLNNLFTPDHNLTKTFLLLNLDEYSFKFGSNLNTWMIHWDNRKEKKQILETLEALDVARKRGLRIGLSGIKTPSVYAELNNSFQFDFRIQLKHNVLVSQYKWYQAFHGIRRFITYGINAGGLKLDPTKYDKTSSLKARGGDVQMLHPIAGKLRQIMERVSEKDNRPPLVNFNQIGMLHAFYAPDIQGILIGPSRLEQLKSSLLFYEEMKQYNYSDIYLQIARFK